MTLKIQLTLFVLCSLALFQPGQGWRRAAPRKGLRLPQWRRLMTYSTFVNKVSGRTWSEIYTVTPDLSSRVELRYTMFPVADGNTVYNPYQVSVDGVCITEFNSSYPTNFTVANPKYAILKSGTSEMQFFSSNPDNYIILILCVDTTVVVHDVCGPAHLSLLVPQFPPNQLDWWGVIWDLRKVMGLELTDPRFRFTAGADLPCN